MRATRCIGSTSLCVDTGIPAVDRAGRPRLRPLREALPPTPVGSGELQRVVSPLSSGPPGRLLRSDTLINAARISRVVRCRKRQQDVAPNCEGYEHQQRYLQAGAL